MNSFKFKKAVQALNYFAKLEGGEINYMKAGKLVYLSDRAHLRTYGRTITNDKYVAMKNGSVPSGTKDIILKSQWFTSDIIDYSNQFLSEPKNFKISSVGDVDEKVFSKTDFKILNDIYKYYGDKDQYSLSYYSHHFPEWMKFRKELEADPGRSFPISLEDFFKDGLKDEPFSQSEELLELSKQEFQHSL
ncbi:SocA family protein [Mucilaginibacter rigui]|uniref:SocA family protein n=1 Tax=Mucilaginibacter rigui TaxID=534635 RepID=A0ABR7WZH6_9SPHI|nr:Panacea domain-containing protein [Mucilaginibacter rigui]MBD1383742.1 SocA family protein [Mucilaginibacter rigui]